MRKFTYEFVKNFIENEKYTLLSTEYINTKTDLNIKCSKGHEFPMPFDEFKNGGNRCPKCKYKKMSQQFSHDFEFVKSIFEERDYILLETEYINGHILMRYICKKHPDKIRKITFTSLYSNGFGCSDCGKEIRVVKRRLDEKFVFDQFIAKGLIPLPDQKYKNAHTNIKYICIKHSNIVQETEYNNLKYGGGCHYCYIESISGENNWGWKGGKKTEFARIRNSPEYKDWRFSVYKKDNFTCQACGDNTGHNLVAHHILNFSEYKDLRFDMDNGTTLCNNCHNPNIKESFHNIYGTYNNTKEQLDEFINSKRRLNNDPKYLSNLY